jgi:hypothetical protein
MMLPERTHLPRWGGCWLAGGLWQSVGMLIEYRGRTPQVDPGACVAPAVVVADLDDDCECCGDLPG